jgi:hypothetical protein
MYTSIKKYLNFDDSVWGENEHSELYRSFKFFTKNSYLLLLSNVYVDMSTGLMYTSDFDLIPESSDEYLFWFPEVIFNKADCFDGVNINNYGIRDEFQKRFDELNSRLNFGQIDLSDIKIIEDICVCLLDPFGEYRYGHLHDVFQKIFANKDYLQNQDSILLISNTDSIANFDFYLDQLGCQFKDHIIYEKNNKNHFVFCKKVYLPLCPTYTTYHSIKYYNEFIIDRLVKSASNNLSNTNNSIEKSIKLYLSRKFFSRCPLMEEELINEVLIPNGWIILYGNENIEDTIRLFSNADKVLGAHGAAFVNTLYCKESCSIFEICCKNRQVISLKEKYKRAKNYSQILVDCNVEHLFSSDILKQFL